jgi:CRISPR/Cas system CMR-associated protein Cmr5 small subunit
MTLLKISSKTGALSIPVAIVIASIFLAVAYFLSESYKIETTNQYKNREIEIYDHCREHAESWAAEETKRICDESPKECSDGYREGIYLTKPYRSALEDCLAGYGLQYTGRKDN